MQGLCVPGRTAVAWFQPSKPELYHYTKFPVFVMEDEELEYPFYGFPEFGGSPGGRCCLAMYSPVLLDLQLAALACPLSLPPCCAADQEQSS